MTGQVHPRAAAAEALKRDDSLAAAAAIRQLVRYAPEDWLEHLLFDGALPGPGQKGFLKHWLCLVQALAHLGTDELPPLEERLRVMQLLAALGILEQGLTRIRADLEHPKLRSMSALTRLWRLAAFAQCECEKNARKMSDTAHPEGFDPIAAMRAVVPIAGGAGAVSISAATESVVDAVELTLRHELHTRTGDVGSLDASVTPYDSPEFMHVATLAQIWRAYEHVWTSVRYQGWRTLSREKEIIWVPPDSRRFKVARAAEFREQLVTYTYLIPILQRSEGWLNHYRGVLDRLANEANLPSPGTPWAIPCPPELLRDFVSRQTFRRVAEFHLRFRHLGPVLKYFEAHAGVGWEAWTLTRNVLSALSEIIQHSHRSTFATEALNSASMRMPVAVERQRLIDVIQESTQLPRNEVERAIDLCVFDPKRKHLDIRDQPLIPVSRELLILVPAAVHLSNPALAVEHVLSDVPDSEFDVRGGPFEESLVDVLTRVPGMEVARGVAFHASDGKRAQFDIVGWWKDHLFLIEAKCVKGITDPAQERKAWENADEALDQLERRRRLVQTDWAALVAKAGEKGVALPADVPAEDHVVSIAVLNELAFTSITRGASVVTDEFCLARYFGPAEVEVGAFGPRPVAKSTTGRIRKEVEPTPQGLAEYLRDPPQVRLFVSKLVPQLHPLPTPDETPMALATLEFSPDEPVSAFDLIDP